MNFKKHKNSNFYFFFLVADIHLRNCTGLHRQSFIFFLLRVGCFLLLPFFPILKKKNFQLDVNVFSFLNSKSERGKPKSIQIFCFFLAGFLKSLQALGGKMNTNESDIIIIIK